MGIISTVLIILGGVSAGEIVHKAVEAKTRKKAMNAALRENNRICEDTQNETDRDD